MLCWLTVVLVAACDTQREPGPEADNAGQGESRTGAAQAGETEPGISVAIRKNAPREYTLYGRTGLAPEIHLTIEDGHNVLFGPTSVPVTGGQFRVDFLLDETDQAQAIAFLQDLEGRRLAVIPITWDQSLITAGEPFDVSDVPPLPGSAMGDRRTRVTADVVESPTFRLRWPAVAEGDTLLRAAGETRLPRFGVAVLRRDSVLAQMEGQASAPGGEWAPFAVDLRVPGGIREGDALVLATGSGPEDRELILQPIRN